MKPDYKNWMPKGMVLGTLAGAIGCFVLFLIFGSTGLLQQGTLKTVLKIVFLAATVICACVTVWMWLMYRAFSYNGKRQMSRQIIEGTADDVTLPEGGIGLDVGCGSGALTIACAKRNPQGRFIGIDRWGKEYASFNKSLCESNAKIEGVDNGEFRRGDANKLDFPDESFDIVISRLAFHHFAGAEEPFKEMVRVLKPGGKLVMIDMVPDDAALRNEVDRIERMRDPSHVRDLIPDEMKELYNHRDIEK